jgi:UDP-GlcNAc:undecaprenyl-phosphate GlcNAc-1-phosphate transferase
MKSLNFDILQVSIISIAAALVLFPLFIKFSPYIGMVDKPNNRKVHSHPIPAIGGFVMVICLIIPCVFYAPAREFILQYRIFYLAVLALMMTGLADDRWDLNVKLRLIIQVTCAAAVATGIRLTSLYGFLGVYELPLILQYSLTIFIIIGVVNAFNLIDGIDGLAGSLALINTLVLAVMSVIVHQSQWLFLLLPMSISLLVFLKYNWKPAKIFMGDSGSLVIGFLISTLGIYFIQTVPAETLVLRPFFIVLITACCMTPVMDSLRVYLGRVQRGKSAFSADQTHLHHFLIHHHLTHTNATLKVIKFQLILIILSVAAIFLLSIAWVIWMQLIAVTFYIWSVQIMRSFYRWYRYIKKMEVTP